MTYHFSFGFILDYWSALLFGLVTTLKLTVICIFFCLPLVLHIELGSLASAIIALSLYMGAISCETFRAAMQAIARDQHDACVALGLRPLAKITHVIFPQTILRAIP